ncbi:uroporphyrinogen decarboxylase [Terrihabitans sp. B22-R8]|uniref:uroporphyrinogen decarboxylase n=1 Tax=Terrihabitans sp. B22-R8 TaxID=3425128 RepID=UPI00403CC9EA
MVNIGLSAQSAKPFLRVLAGEVLDTPPLWMMRQAGRYLPEYRALRAEAGSFLDLCYNPEFAAEVTLQPIRRFGFDAAILFSDILIIPHALGLGLQFLEGEGPKLEVIRDAAELGRLRNELDSSKTKPVYDAIRLIRTSLPTEVALIGFVGAPWTVATYIAAGGGSKDHAEARLWALRDPQGFDQLMRRLIDASVEHLAGQIEAGAEAVQIFDSWGGELPPREFEHWCIRPVAEIVARLRALHPTVPIIAFPRGAGSKLQRFGEGVPGVAIGLDTAESPSGAALLLPADRVTQGNLDPLVLVAGGAALDRAVDDILEGFSNRSHVFNLGHGIRQETPIAHVEQLVRRVRRGM